MILHAQTPFEQSDVKTPLLSVGKLTKSGADVKFGRKGSRIDLHTDSGVPRVLVRVKGKFSGFSIQKTNAWTIPETDDATPRAEVAAVAEEIGGGEAPNPPPAALAAAAAPRPEETQGMRLEREAVTLQQAGRARDRWDNHSAKEDSRVAATLMTCETG